MNDSFSSDSTLVGSEAGPLSSGIDLKWLPNLASRVVRWVARGVVLVMLMIGVYYAFQVFFQVGSLVRDPSTAAVAVETVAQLIEADKLRFNHAGETVEVGRLVAVLVLGLGYVLWAWIPLWIIGTAARVLKSLQCPTAESAQEITGS